MVDNAPRNKLELTVHKVQHKHTWVIEEKIGSDTGRERCTECGACYYYYYSEIWDLLESERSSQLVRCGCTHAESSHAELGRRTCSECPCTDYLWNHRCIHNWQLDQVRCAACDAYLNRAHVVIRAMTADNYRE